MFRNMPSNQYKPFYEPTPPNSRPSSTPIVTRGPTPPHSRPSSGPRPTRNQDMGEDRPVSAPRDPREKSPIKSRPPSGPRPPRDVDSERDRDRDRPLSGPRAGRGMVKSSSSSRSLKDTDQPLPQPLLPLERTLSVLVRPPAIDINEPPPSPKDDIPSISPHTIQRKTLTPKTASAAVKKN